MHIYTSHVIQYWLNITTRPSPSSLQKLTSDFVGHYCQQRGRVRRILQHIYTSHTIQYWLNITIPLSSSLQELAGRFVCQYHQQRGRVRRAQESSATRLAVRRDPDVRLGQRLCGRRSDAVEPQHIRVQDIAR